MIESINYYIPKRIDVGLKSNKSLHEFDSTKSGFLGFVTYKFDGKLKCEKSWNSWRDTSINPLDIENVPTEGFSLDFSKVRISNFGHHKNYICRVQDPRGFDFEISIDNLFWICQYEGVEKGSKTLTGEFVYGWEEGDSRQVILLPCSSENYQDWQERSEAKRGFSSSKVLIPGHIYETTYNERALYVGKFKVAKSLGGKNYETQNLFTFHYHSLSPTRRQLVCISPQSIKIDRGEFSGGTEIVKELEDAFNQTAYSLEFWKSDLCCISRFLSPEESEKQSSNFVNREILRSSYYIDSMFYRHWDFYTKKLKVYEIGEYIKSTEINLLRPIRVLLPGETRSSQNVIKNSKVDRLLKIKLDSTGGKLVWTDNFGEYDFNAGITAELKYIKKVYPNSNDKCTSLNYTSTEGVRCTIVYETVSGLYCDSLSVLAFTDYLYCPSRLKVYSLPWKIE